MKPIYISTKNTIGKKKRITLKIINLWTTKQKAHQKKIQESLPKNLTKPTIKTMPRTLEMTLKHIKKKNKIGERNSEN